MPNRIFLAGLLLGASLGLRGDAHSGPGRHSILQTRWGSFYHEQAQTEAQHLEHTHFGFRLRSAEGEVLIQRIPGHGFRLTCGQEHFLIYRKGADLELRGPAGDWKLQVMANRCEWQSPAPKDHLLFDRTAARFTIKGDQGLVTVTAHGDQLTVESPLGTSRKSRFLGRQSHTGPALEQVPYLGRGFWLSFHGVGVFIDLAKVFPMPEVARWVEWKPIL